MCCAGRMPPFDPKEVVGEYAARLLKEYRIRGVVGDDYAAAWVEQVGEPASDTFARSFPKVDCTSRACRRLPAAPWRCPTILGCCANCGCSSAASMLAAGTLWITVELAGWLRQLRVWPLAMCLQAENALAYGPDDKR